MIFVVANLGVNWFCDDPATRAEQLFDAAAAAGAHGVCVPYLRAEKLFSEKDKIDKLKKFDLSAEILYDLRERAKRSNTTFWVAPSDASDVGHLEQLGIDGYHIQNGYLEVEPLLQAVAKTKKPVMLSTGFATVEEINFAVETILNVRDTDAAEAEVMILHSTGAMPTPAEEAQLRAILDLAETFMPLFVGYESFTSSQNVVLDYIAMAFNPAVIMRRIDLGDNAGIETEYSLTPTEFKRLVDTAAGMTAVNSPAAYAEGFVEGDFDARIKRRRCKKSNYLLPPSQ